MTYNAGERKDIRAAEKAASVTTRQRREVIGGIMSVAPGRAWVHQILTDCHIFANPFSTDPMITAFACGEMNVGQKLLVDIMAMCPDQYIQMQREANERSAAGERGRSQNRNGGDQTGPVDDSGGTDTFPADSSPGPGED